MDTRKSKEIQKYNEKIILKTFGEAVLFIKDLQSQDLTDSFETMMHGSYETLDYDT